VRFMCWRARITIKRIILKKEFLKGQYLQLGPGPLPHSNHKLVPFLMRHANGWQLKWDNSEKVTPVYEFLGRRKKFPCTKWTISIPGAAQEHSNFS